MLTHIAPGLTTSSLGNLHQSRQNDVVLYQVSGLVRLISDSPQLGVIKMQVVAHLGQGVDASN